MFTQIEPALVIARREVRDQLRDWRIILPVMALTIFFPFLMNFTAQQMLDFVNQYGASLIGERLVPFLMMIVGFFPISVSLVIALESFVGEKERGSIEPLLNTPLKDWQLYLGKLLSATVPPLFASFLGMLVYLSGLLIGHIPLPEAQVMILIFVLTITQAVVMVSGAVVVSTQATSIRSANLLASFIIIPVALLIQAESVVMFWGTYQTLWWAVVGLMVLAFLLVRVGLAHFQREELLGREIDVLNLAWGWGVFKRRFVGSAHSVGEWFRREVPQTVASLRMPLLISAILALAAVYLGAQEFNTIKFPLDRTNFARIDQGLQSLIQVWPVFSFGPVVAIWWQNLRVLLLAMLLGSISFGIFGVIPMFATMGITGYLMALLEGHGISGLQYFVGFILPHGITEIPAVLISVAAVLKAGAILATPDIRHTVGEVYLSALADWSKVMVGVVIPLLFIAACIEAWVTPRLALWLIPLLK
jgi:ABC-type transport system involved in multi-copper enzyme maturation permease subunit